MAAASQIRRVASVYPRISRISTCHRTLPLSTHRGEGVSVPPGQELRRIMSGPARYEAGDRYGQLVTDVRRHNYPSGYVPLSAVLPWPDYCRANTLHVNKAALAPDKVQEVLGGSRYTRDSTLNQRVSMYVGDITRLEVDAIVNAANNSLRGGGGVDGAIHRAAGKQLFEECVTLNGCDTGDAKITGGYRLPASYVIHTVGPVGERPVVLESCYRRSLQLCVENSLRTVAFPCISTGVYGYPGDAAVQVVLPVVRTMLEAHPQDLDRVIFCLFLKSDVELYHRYMPVFFPLDDGE